MGSESRTRSTVMMINNVSTYLCGICMDEKTNEEIFINIDCNYSNDDNHDHHPFCLDCIGQHVSSKVRDNAGANVKCPDLRCSALLEPQNCRILASLLPDELIVRWEAAVYESIVRSRRTSYCPFEDCGAPMDDGEESSNAGPAACPYCGRLFCARCRDPWHAGSACKKRRRRKKKKGKGEKVDNERARAKNVKSLDRKFKGLAKSERWKRCPGCKIYVQKQYGCEHIRCRCYFEFCYLCGKAWSRDHDCPFRFMRRQMMRIRAMLKKVPYLFSCR